MADDGRNNDNTRGGRGGFGAASLRDALRAVAGLREPTTRPTYEDQLQEPQPVQPHPQPQAVTEARDAPIELEAMPVYAPEAVAQPHRMPEPQQIQQPDATPPASLGFDTNPPSMASAQPQRVMQTDGQTVLLRPREEASAAESAAAPAPAAPTSAPVAIPVTAVAQDVHPEPEQVASAVSHAANLSTLQSTATAAAVAVVPAMSQKSVEPSPATPVTDSKDVALAPEKADRPAMTDLSADDNKTRMVRGVQKPGRDDYYQEPVVAWLVVIGGPGLGAFRPVYEGNNALGRAPTQRISIDFGDDAISAEEQAYIRYDSTDRSFLFVPNLAKTNVVSLNESKPTSAVQLSPMDVITVGQTQLVFVPFCGPEFDWSELQNISSGA